MARLQFYRGTTPEGSSPLFVVRLGQTRTRIGRTDDCDVVLPDEQVSRSHALLDLLPDAVVLHDRSTNGTWVNGRRVEGRVTLHDRDVVRFGGFSARLDLHGDNLAPPTERAQLEARDEEVLDGSDGLAVNTAWLVVVGGPAQGQRIPLTGARPSVGGPGSKVAVADPALVANHVYIRLASGRAMLEAGSGAAWIGTSRVRDIVPLFPGEEARIGDTELRVEWALATDQPTADHFGDLVGQTPNMRAIFGTLRRMAAHQAPILLGGESGTGKELAARAIHEASPRAPGRFVALNCAAITPTLFESELFGHEKGAFTGAEARRDGAFHRADGGTLFLDEVGELSEDAQSKLLRALESGEVRRVGGAEPTWPDVRVIAATNRSLVDEVKAGRFRADLYFRLAVLAVRLPPLRERPDDIPVIAEAIAKRVAPELRLAPSCLTALRQHPWPGNARELRNVITRAYVLHGPFLESEHLSFTAEVTMPPSNAGELPLEQAEKDLVVEALRKANQNRSEAARLLGIARSTLLYKLQKWGIQ